MLNATLMKTEPDQIMARFCREKGIRDPFEIDVKKESLETFPMKYMWDLLQAAYNTGVHDTSSVLGLE